MQILVKSYPAPDLVETKEFEEPYLVDFESKNMLKKSGNSFHYREVINTWDHQEKSKDRERQDDINNVDNARILSFAFEMNVISD